MIIKPPVCPLCHPEAVYLLRQIVRPGEYRYRCPRCHLSFLSPVPTVEELPPLRYCPECQKHDRVQILVWLDNQIQWCPVCNYSVEVLTARQQAAREMAIRKVVGEWGRCRGVRSGGGGKIKNKRGKDRKQGFSLTRVVPLDVDSDSGRRDHQGRKKRKP